MQKSALLSRPYTTIDVTVPSDVVTFRPGYTDAIIFTEKRCYSDDAEINPGDRNL